MFKGYNLELDKMDPQIFLCVTDEELEELDKNHENLKNLLRDKLTHDLELPKDENGVIDGSRIINDWFPEYKADVFISHSHQDERTAKRLAVWLKKKFNLTVFIDSIIWGSSNALLKNIDDEYSLLRKDENNITYNYDIRNLTTSHVHMMLSTALSDMIDQTECLIFLNTPESVTVNSSVNKKTYSPWIYNELKVASIVRKLKPSRGEKTRFRTDSSNTVIKNSMDIGYSVDKELSTMKQLDKNILIRWADSYKVGEDHALDVLYSKVENNE